MIHRTIPTSLVVNRSVKVGSVFGFPRGCPSLAHQEQVKLSMKIQPGHLKVPSARSHWPARRRRISEQSLHDWHHDSCKLLVLAYTHAALAKGALSPGGRPAPFAMVASQHRVPRIYPLPKKVLSHSVFRALLERRRHTLDSLIVLLKSGTEKADEGNFFEKLPDGKDRMQVDGNEEIEQGPPSDPSGLHREDGEAAERAAEMGNNGLAPAGVVEEEREGEAQEGNEKRVRSGDSQEAAERDGLNGGLAADGDEGTRARGNIDQRADVLRTDGDDALTREDETTEDPSRETPREEGNLAAGEASASAEGDERKAVEKAELEEKLNKLESKKHKLVQQLKQVLVREDSRKIVRPPFAPSPAPSPSSLTVSSNYYLPNASPLPSAASSHPSPLATANQFTAPLKRDDEALEEGELPEGGSPHQNAKPQVEAERGPSLGSAGDWDRTGERGRLVHSAWDQRNDRYFLGGERPSVVSPKAGFGSRMGSPYYQPLSLRRNFSLGPNLSGPNRFPLRSTGSGIGLESMISPQDPMLPSPLGDSLGGPSPGGGMSNFQSRPRGK